MIIPWDDYPCLKMKEVKNSSTYGKQARKLPHSRVDLF